MIRKTDRKTPGQRHYNLQTCVGCRCIAVVYLGSISSKIRTPPSLKFRIVKGRHRDHLYPKGDTVAKTPYARVQQFIEEKAPLWQERMLLQHIKIEHVFLDTYYGDDGEEDFKVTAVTESRWQYFQAKIKWYLPSAVRHDEDHLEEVLVHELCHVMLAAEQVLIDSRLRSDAADSRFTDDEHARLQERNYEHLEHATEMAAKAILNCFRLSPEGNGS